MLFEIKLYSDVPIQTRGTWFWSTKNFLNLGLEYQEELSFDDIDAFCIKLIEESAILKYEDLKLKSPFIIANLYEYPLAKEYVLNLDIGPLTKLEEHDLSIDDLKNTLQKIMSKIATLDMKMVEDTTYRINKSPKIITKKSYNISEIISERYLKKE